jgi:hypothetical protein
MIYMMGMVSRSATFQSVTGSADATAALDRIRLYSFEEEFAEGEGLDPSVIVPIPRASIFPNGLSSQRATTTTVSSQPRIVVEIELEIPSTVGRTHHQQALWACPIFENIIDEIWGLSAPPQPGQLNIQQVEVVQPPIPLRPDEYGGRLLWVCTTEFVAHG